MRLGPVGFLGVGRKQAITDEVPQVVQPPAHLLVETCLIASVGDQLQRTDDQHRALSERQAVDGAELPRELDHALDRRFGIDIGRVADDWAGSGLRNAGRRGSRGHGSLR